MRKVYQNVELIRKAIGYTKKEMACKMGISEMAYSRISLGQSKITCEALELISTIFCIENITVFFNDELTDSVIKKITENKKNLNTIPIPE